MPIGTLVNELSSNWGWVALRGAAAIVFGILAFMWPGMTALILLMFIAAWAIVTGILQVVAAIASARRSTTNGSSSCRVCSR